MKEKEIVWRKLMPKDDKKRRRLAKGFPIVRKVFKDLSREKTILFAIMLQVFIILATSILITNSANLFSPDEMLGEDTVIGITGDIDLTETLSTYFGESNLDFALYSQYGEAIDSFMEGDIDGIVSMSRDSHLPIYIDMYVPQGDAKTSMIMTEMKDILEVYENDLREQNIAQPDAVMLDRLRMTERSNNVVTQIYETLYSILIPFLLLMPGILLGGLVIDILIEELEKKTLNILMLIITFKIYIFELILATLTMSMLQVISWQFLLAVQGITMNNLPQITLLVMLLNLIMFIMCIIITLAVMDKTKAQLIYSFLVLLLFASMPLFSINPIRVISRLSIGIVPVSFVSYASILSIITVALFISMMFSIRGKEW